MLAPVILFVYNRPEHTRGVLESLSQNRLAKESELFIFSDAAKNDAAKEKVDMVRVLIKEKGWKEAFKQVTVVEGKENRGLAKSIISGVTELINQYGKVIVIEDDLILSPYFLDYMNGALEFYEREKDIWSISGYSFPMKSLKKYSHDVFYSYRGCSWGWATWADRWMKTDWDVKDYQQFLADDKKQRHFNLGGGDLTGMLKLQMEGKINSWAVRWVYMQSKLNMYTVYPKKSYILNDGCDGSGTNSGTHSELDTDISESMEICRFEKLELDKKIVHEFYVKYTDTFNKKIKRNLNKIRKNIFHF